MQGCTQRGLALVLVTVLSIAGASERAVAGPNAGGVLIVHANESISYCQDIPTYCASSGLTQCEDADVSVNGGGTFVFFALAAFAEGSSPRMTALTFGVHLDPAALVITAKGQCADFELAQSGWPGDGTGTALTWNAAKTALLTPVYWFAGYNYAAPAATAFALTPHPSQGGWFADDSIPSLLDPIAGYGSLGFNSNGAAPCPAPLPILGACCLPEGTCIVTQASDCNGSYQGDGSSCVPNPCPLLLGACCLPEGGCSEMTRQSCNSLGGLWNGYGTLCASVECPTQGACCFDDGHCVVLSSGDCASQGGMFQNAGSDCEPNYCVPILGACCLADGGCEALSQADCQAQFGEWRGADTLCETETCSPPGACCFEGDVCTQLTYSACLAMGGAYAGDTPCDPNPCPSIGACCFPDGQCEVRFNIDCEYSGGIFHDEALDCDPNPCPTPCTLRPTVRRENAPAPLTSPAAWPPSGVAGNRESSRGGSRGALGANANGVLLLHTNPALVYSTDPGPFCGQAGLDACANAITEVSGGGPAVIFALAAFSEGSQPRMAGVSFGIEYGHCVVLEAWGPCADHELATPTWPESGQGTALTWDNAQTTILTELYWFAAYTYDGAVDRITLTPHPTDGAFFVDDSVPPVIDPVGAFGTFGFGQPGSAECPPLVTPSGACCLGTSCVVRTESQCVQDGGVYLGDGVSCSDGICGGGGGCVAVTGSGAGGGNAIQTGLGQSIVSIAADPTRSCSLVFNADGGYENGYAWQYGGVVAPDYGAFAECYTGANSSLCSVVFDFTQTGFYQGQCMDVYVWADAGGIPGNVLCVKNNVQVGDIAFWPSFSRHVVDLSGCCAEANFWVGYWGNWPGQFAPWYVGADLTGSGGCPFTNIAPGIGYPTGWGSVSLVWGPTQALGIGCETFPCAPVATKKMSWGKVKALYGGDGSKTR